MNPANTLYAAAFSFAPASATQANQQLQLAQSIADLLKLQLRTSPILRQRWGNRAWPPDRLRRADLHQALQSAWIACTRGGYGAIHLAEDLAAARPPRPVGLLGFSDSTVLHAAWARFSFGPAVYAGLADLNAPQSGLASASLRNCLLGQPWTIQSHELPVIRPLNTGHADGPAFAACLSVLARLCGTGLLPDLRGNILFIEDINEPAYRCDFALHQLWLAGHLNGIAGLVGGSFSEQNRPDHDHGPTVDDVLCQWAARLGIPAASRVPFGHIEDPAAIPQGWHVALRVQHHQTTIAFDPPPATA